MLGSVCRRAGHHDRAHALTLGAADQLGLSGKTPDPEHLSLHGVLICSAGYAAARPGDRDRAGDLVSEAAATADRLAGHSARRRELLANVSSHQVSAAYVLGDAGSAWHHARAARLDSFSDPERQGRFLVDVALAHAQWDKPEQAYRALIEAGHRAPGEVRTRSAVRGLVADLMRHRNHAAPPGLRDLAVRTHVMT
jgi:hypothetical protein